MTAYVPGYSVTMRKDKRTGEHLAVISAAYTNQGRRYYMAIGESDGCWTELTPEYVTRRTMTVSEYPEWLKRRIDQSLGYIMNVAPRLYR